MKNLKYLPLALTSLMLLTGCKLETITLDTAKERLPLINEKFLMRLDNLDQFSIKIANRIDENDVNGYHKAPLKETYYSIYLSKGYLAKSEYQDNKLIVDKVEYFLNDTYYSVDLINKIVIKDNQHDMQEFINKNTTTFKNQFITFNDLYFKKSFQESFYHDYKYLKQYLDTYPALNHNYKINKALYYFYGDGVYLKHTRDEEYSQTYINKNKEKISSTSSISLNVSYEGNFLGKYHYYNEEFLDIEDEDKNHSWEKHYILNEIECNLKCETKYPDIKDFKVVNN